MKPLGVVASNDRAALVRRGVRLSYASIGYNSLEAIASLIAGVVAGSVSLFGFGVDSVIEVVSSSAAQWRLRSDFNAAGRERIERITHKVIGWSFLALALYIIIDSASSLWLHAALAMVPVIGREGAEGIRGGQR